MSSILFINRVYPPEDGATGRVLEHMAKGLVKEGWKVSVLTTSGGTSRSGTTFSDGVKIIRVGGLFSKRSLISRALGYALMIPMFFFKATLLPRFDFIVTKTDPPMLLLIAPLLRLIKGSRLIHWAQDLYPEVAVELGVFKSGGAMTQFLFFVSSLAMRMHERVIVVGRCMVKRVLARGILPERIAVIANTGVEQDIVPVEHASNPFRRKYGLEGYFVVEYSGNLGRAHEFETVIQAARRLEHAGENKILFLVIGGGPGRAEFMAQVGELGLKNVRFLEAQSAVQLGESLAAADAHLVTMKTAMEGLVVPSKFYGVLAVGKPCLFVGPAGSEVACVISEFGVGAVISPGDVSELVTTILKYRNDPQLIESSRVHAEMFLRNQDSLRQFIDSLVPLTVT